MLDMNDAKSGKNHAETIRTFFCIDIPESIKARIEKLQHDLRRIDATSRDVLVVQTGQGSEVTFALQNLEHQLRRWRTIHDKGMQIGRNVASIDLAVSNNVPVRWLEANISPAPAKPPKTTRTRKRNV
jgi:cell division septal protein FtsQ